jgi:hypothetical protein
MDQEEKRRRIIVESIFQQNGSAGYGLAISVFYFSFYDLGRSNRCK